MLSLLRHTVTAKSILESSILRIIQTLSPSKNHKSIKNQYDQNRNDDLVNSIRQNPILSYLQKRQQKVFARTLIFQ